MNFDSGWEWGYWLSDVITARASWDPLVDPSFAGAVKGGDPMLTVWEAFEEALLPLVRELWVVFRCLGGYSSVQWL